MPISDIYNYYNLPEKGHFLGAVIRRLPRNYLFYFPIQTTLAS
jgi:hypothetical protein